MAPNDTHRHHQRIASSSRVAKHAMTTLLFIVCSLFSATPGLIDATDLLFKPTACRASSTYSSSYVCSRAYDTFPTPIDVDTSYTSGKSKQYAGKGGGPHFVEFDLGSVKTVGGMYYQHRPGTNAEADKATSFNIWVTTSKFSNISNPSSSSNWYKLLSTTERRSRDLQRFTFGKQFSGRYVLIKLGKGTWNVGISTIAFFKSLDLLSQAQQPFQGKLNPIPGILQAENYDEGSGGHWAYTTSTTLPGTHYRNDTNSLIYTGPSKWESPKMIHPKESNWFVYSIKVAKSGRYAVYARACLAGSQTANRYFFHLQTSSGSEATSEITMTQRRCASPWDLSGNKWHTKQSTIDLKTSDTLLVLSVYGNAAYRGSLLDYFDFEPAERTPFDANNVHQIPGTIPAAQFDTGAFNTTFKMNSYELPKGNYSGPAASNASVPIYTCSSLEQCPGPQTWVSFYTGYYPYWLSYTVNFTQTGYYNCTARARYARGGIRYAGFQLAIDSMDFSQRVVVRYKWIYSSDFSTILSLKPSPILFTGLRIIWFTGYYGLDVESFAFSLVKPLDEQQLLNENIAKYHTKLPGRLEFENYISEFDTYLGSRGNATYRNLTNVDLYTAKDNISQVLVSGIYGTQVWNYSIEVETAGLYYIHFGGFSRYKWSGTWPRYMNMDITKKEESGSYRVGKGFHLLRGACNDGLKARPVETVVLPAGNFTLSLTVNDRHHTDFGLFLDYLQFDLVATSMLDSPIPDIFAQRTVEIENFTRLEPSQAGKNLLPVPPYSTKSASIGNASWYRPSDNLTDGYVNVFSLPSTSGGGYAIHGYGSDITDFIYIPLFVRSSTRFSIQARVYYTDSISHYLYTYLHNYTYNSSTSFNRDQGRRWRSASGRAVRKWHVIGLVSAVSEVPGYYYLTLSCPHDLYIDKLYFTPISGPYVTPVQTIPGTIVAAYYDFGGYYGYKAQDTGKLKDFRPGPFEFSYFNGSLELLNTVAVSEWTPSLVGVRQNERLSYTVDVTAGYYDVYFEGEASAITNQRGLFYLTGAVESGKFSFTGYQKDVKIGRVKVTKSGRLTLRIYFSSNEVKFITSLRFVSVSNHIASPYNPGILRNTVIQASEYDYGGPDIGYSVTKIQRSISGTLPHVRSGDLTNILFSESQGSCLFMYPGDAGNYTFEVPSSIPTFVFMTTYSDRYSSYHNYTLFANGSEIGVSGRLRTPTSRATTRIFKHRFLLNTKYTLQIQNEGPRYLYFYSLELEYDLGAALPQKCVYPGKMSSVCSLPQTGTSNCSGSVSPALGGFNGGEFKFCPFTQALFPDSISMPKDCRASSTYSSSYVCSRAYDTFPTPIDVDTSYTSGKNKQYAGKGGGPHFVEFDLGSVKTVGGMYYQHRPGTNAEADKPTSLHIWVTTSKFSDVTNPQNAPDWSKLLSTTERRSRDLQRFTFGKQFSGRYVLIKLGKGTSNVGISTIAFFKSLDGLKSNAGNVLSMAAPFYLPGVQGMLLHIAPRTIAALVIPRIQGMGKGMRWVPGDVLSTGPAEFRVAEYSVKFVEVGVKTIWSKTFSSKIEVVDFQSVDNHFVIYGANSKVLWRNGKYTKNRAYWLGFSECSMKIYYSETSNSAVYSFGSRSCTRSVDLADDLSQYNKVEAIYTSGLTEILGYVQTATQYLLPSGLPRSPLEICSNGSLRVAYVPFQQVLRNGEKLQEVRAVNFRSRSSLAIGGYSWISSSTSCNNILSGSDDMQMFPGLLFRSAVRYYQYSQEGCFQACLVHDGCRAVAFSKQKKSKRTKSATYCVYATAMPTVSLPRFGESDVGMSMKLSQDIQPFRPPAIHTDYSLLQNSSFPTTANWSTVLLWLQPRSRVEIRMASLDALALSVPPFQFTDSGDWVFVGSAGWAQQCGPGTSSFDNASIVGDFVIDDCKVPHRYVSCGAGKFNASKRDVPVTILASESATRVVCNKNHLVVAYRFQGTLAPRKPAVQYTVLRESPASNLLPYLQSSTVIKWDVGQKYFLEFVNTAPASVSRGNSLGCIFQEETGFIARGGQKGSVSSCRPMASISELLRACEEDDSCIGFDTTLVVNGEETVELPGCLQRSANTTADSTGVFYQKRRTAPSVCTFTAGGDFTELHMEVLQSGFLAPNAFLTFRVNGRTLFRCGGYEHFEDGESGSGLCEKPLTCYNGPIFVEKNDVITLTITRSVTSKGRCDFAAAAIMEFSATNFLFSNAATLFSQYPLQRLINLKGMAGRERYRLTARGVQGIAGVISARDCFGAASDVSANFKAIGPYKDKSLRAMEHRAGSFSLNTYGFSAKSCNQYCRAFGYTYFGIQNYRSSSTQSQCFCSNNLATSTRYGAGRCSSKGGSWCNYIYETCPLNFNCNTGSRSGVDITGIYRYIELGGYYYPKMVTMSTTSNSTADSCNDLCIKNKFSVFALSRFSSASGLAYCKCSHLLNETIGKYGSRSCHGINKFGGTSRSCSYLYLTCPNGTVCNQDRLTEDDSYRQLFDIRFESELYSVLHRNSSHRFPSAKKALCTYNSSNSAGYLACNNTDSANFLPAGGVINVSRLDQSQFYCKQAIVKGILFIQGATEVIFEERSRVRAMFVFQGVSSRATQTQVAQWHGVGVDFVRMFIPTISYQHTDVWSSKTENRTYSLYEIASVPKKWNRAPNETLACVVDAFLDQYSRPNCEVDVSGGANYVTFQVAQTHFFDTQAKVVLVMGQRQITCGGRNSFSNGFFGKSGLCSTYFTCYQGRIPEGVTHISIVYQAPASPSDCFPAAVSLVKVEQRVIQTDLNCSASENELARGLGALQCRSFTPPICLPPSTICNGVVDCPDSSDESFCSNWRLVSRSLSPTCSQNYTLPPQPLISFDDCRSWAIAHFTILSASISFLWRENELCIAYDCLDITSPQDSLEKMNPEVEAELYVRDGGSLNLCSNELSCSGRGVVQSQTPPCSCECDEGYTGAECTLAEDMTVVDSVTMRFTNISKWDNTVAARVQNAVEKVLQSSVFTPEVEDDSTVNDKRVMISLLSTSATALERQSAYKSLLQPSSQQQFKDLLNEAIDDDDVNGGPGNAPGGSRKRQNVGPLAGPAEVMAVTEMSAPTVFDNMYTASCIMESFASCHVSFPSPLKNYPIYMTKIVVQFPGVTTSSATALYVTVQGKDFACDTLEAGLDETTQGVCAVITQCIISNLFLDVWDGKVVYIKVGERDAISFTGCRDGLTKSYSDVAMVPQISVHYVALLANTSYAKNVYMKNTEGQKHAGYFTGGVLIAVFLGAVFIISSVLLAIGCCTADEPDSVAASPGAFYTFVGGTVFISLIILTIGGGMIAYATSDEFRKSKEWIFFDEFRSSLCSHSPISPIPHRVSRVPGDRVCHRVEAVGTTEGTAYIKAACHAPKKRFTGEEFIGYGNTPSSCKDAPLRTVFTPYCVEERTFFPGKAPDEQQWMEVRCFHVNNGDTRFNELLSKDAAQKQPAELDTPVDLPNEALMLSGTTLNFYLASRKVATPRLEATSGVLSYSSYAPGYTIPAGVRTEEVVYINSKGERHSPRLGGPRNPISALGTLYNGFGTKIHNSGIEAAQGAHRYQGLEDTAFEFADMHNGEFTVSFWMKADGSTRGFVFVLTDNWYHRQTFKSPIVARLLQIIENGMQKKNYFSSTWHSYGGLYVNGNSKTIRFVWARPGEVVELLWETKTLPTEEGEIDVFNNRWHYVVIAFSLVNSRRQAQLFVDGESHFTEHGWLQCFPERTEIPKMVLLPSEVVVYDKLEEIVAQNGVMFLGHLNAGLWNLQVHEEFLEHEQIVAMGANGMEKHVEILVPNSYALGIGLVCACCFYFVWGAYFLYNEYVETKEEEEKEQREQELEEQGTTDAPDDTKTQTAMAKEGGKASQAQGTGKAVSAGANAGQVSSKVPSSGVHHLWVIVPAFLDVMQALDLFITGFRWPTKFTNIMGWIVSWFSFDINLPFPNIPSIVSPILQFVLSVFTILIMLYLCYTDHQRFQERMEKQKKNQSDDDIPVPKNKRNWKLNLKLSMVGQRMKIKGEIPDQESYPFVASLLEAISYLDDLAHRDIDRYESPERISLRGMELLRWQPKCSFTWTVRYSKMVSGHVIVQRRGELHYDVFFRTVFTGQAPVDPTQPKKVENPEEQIFAVTISQITPRKCPVHERRLIKGQAEYHGQVPDIQGEKPYICALKGNTWYKRVCQDGDSVAVCEGTSSSYYVCPVDDCTFTMCNNCHSISWAGMFMAWLATKLYVFERKGALAVVGLFMVLLSQALYMPIMKSCLMLVACHPMYQCVFPGCYRDSSILYLIAVIWAVLIIVSMGIGLVAFLFLMVIRRKNAVMRSGLVDGTQLWPGLCDGCCCAPESNDIQDALRNVDEHGCCGSCCNGMGQLQFLFVDAPEKAWGLTLSKDLSMLKAMYEQYEFKYMIIHPVLLVFKSLLVIPVALFEPNSLLQLFLAAGASFFLLVFISHTNAYRNMWLDALAKLGSLHTLCQLSFMCFHRVFIYEDPDNETMAYWMFVAAGTYFIFVVLIIYVVVIRPWWEARKARKEEEARKSEEALMMSTSKRSSPGGLNASFVENSAEPFSGTVSNLNAAATVVSGSTVDDGSPSGHSPDRGVSQPFQIDSSDPRFWDTAVLVVCESARAIETNAYPLRSEHPFSLPIEMAMSAMSQHPDISYIPLTLRYTSEAFERMVEGHMGCCGGKVNKDAIVQDLKKEVLELSKQYANHTAWATTVSAPLQMALFETLFFNDDVTGACKWPQSSDVVEIIPVQRPEFYLEGKANDREGCHFCFGLDKDRKPKLKPLKSVSVKYLDDLLIGVTLEDVDGTLTNIGDERTTPTETTEKAVLEDKEYITQVDYKSTEAIRESSLVFNARYDKNIGIKIQFTTSTGRTFGTKFASDKLTGDNAWEYDWTVPAGESVVNLRSADVTGTSAKTISGIETATTDVNNIKSKTPARKTRSSSTNRGNKSWFRVHTRKVLDEVEFAFIPKSSTQDRRIGRKKKHQAHSAKVEMTNDGSRGFWTLTPVPGGNAFTVHATSPSGSLYWKVESGSKSSSDIYLETTAVQNQRAAVLSDPKYHFQFVDKKKEKFDMTVYSDVLKPLLEQRLFAFVLNSTSWRMFKAYTKQGARLYERGAQMTISDIKELFSELAVFFLPQASDATVLEALVSQFVNFEQCPENIWGMEEKLVTVLANEGKVQQSIHRGEALMGKYVKDMISQSGPLYIAAVNDVEPFIDDEAFYGFEPLCSMIVRLIQLGYMTVDSLAMDLWMGNSTTLPKVVFQVKGGNELIADRKTGFSRFETFSPTFQELSSMLMSKEAKESVEDCNIEEVSGHAMDVLTTYFSYLEHDQEAESPEMEALQTFFGDFFSPKLCHVWSNSSKTSKELFALDLPILNICQSDKAGGNSYRPTHKRRKVDKIRVFMTNAKLESVHIEYSEGEPQRLGRASSNATEFKLALEEDEYLVEAMYAEERQWREVQTQEGIKKQLVVVPRAMQFKTSLGRELPLTPEMAAPLKDDSKYHHLMWKAPARRQIVALRLHLQAAKVLQMIKSVQLRHGENIDAIIMSFGDRETRHMGGKGGSLQAAFMLGEGEYITKIQYYHRSKYRGDNFQLTTNMGNTYGWNGNSRGFSNTWEAKPGQQIVDLTWDRDDSSVKGKLTGVKFAPVADTTGMDVRVSDVSCEGILTFQDKEIGPAVDAELQENHSAWRAIIHATIVEGFLFCGRKLVSDFDSSYREKVLKLLSMSPSEQKRVETEAQEKKTKREEEKKRKEKEEKEKRREEKRKAEKEKERAKNFEKEQRRQKKLEDAVHNGTAHLTTTAATDNHTKESNKKKKKLNGSNIEYKYPSGSVYKGGFKNGQLDGYGSYTYCPSGDKYEGYWKEDVKHGEGWYTYACGDVYHGKFVNGAKSGAGVYTFANSDRYDGDWENNMMHGFGTFSIAKNKNVYAGNWKNSYRCGFGVLTVGETAEVYQGMWLKGKENGEGVLVGAWGTLYAGEWKNGQKHGKAITCTVDKQKYRCEYELGVEKTSEKIEVDEDVEKAGWEKANGLFLYYQQHGKVDAEYFSAEAKKEEKEKTGAKSRELKKDHLPKASFTYKGSVFTYYNADTVYSGGYNCNGEGCGKKHLKFSKDGGYHAESTKEHQNGFDLCMSCAKAHLEQENEELLESETDSSNDEANKSVSSWASASTASSAAKFAPTETDIQLVSILVENGSENILPAFFHAATVDLINVKYEVAELERIFQDSNFSKKISGIPEYLKKLGKGLDGDDIADGASCFFEIGFDQVLEECTKNMENGEEAAEDFRQFLEEWISACERDNMGVSLVAFAHFLGTVANILEMNGGLVSVPKKGILGLVSITELFLTAPSDARKEIRSYYHQHMKEKREGEDIGAETKKSTLTAAMLKTLGTQLQEESAPSSFNFGEKCIQNGEKK